MLNPITTPGQKTSHETFISISWQSSKKRLSNFPLLSHLIYSASISNKNCRNCRWLSADPLMKFTVDTTIFMTDSTLITLLHNACWCMMHYNCMGGLKFEHSISVLMRVTTPELVPTMLFAPSVVTQQSSFQFKWRRLRIPHSFWKISSPVVVPFKLWRPANSSVISNSASIPRTNISKKMAVFWVVAPCSLVEVYLVNFYQTKR
jgi:hypothetical protein